MHPGRDLPKGGHGEAGGREGYDHADDPADDDNDDGDAAQDLGLSGHPVGASGVAAGLDPLDNRGRDGVQEAGDEPGEGGDGAQEQRVADDVGPRGAREVDEGDL